MTNIVVLGTQWGDEGKGKIIDVLTEKSDYVVRYHGGNNAGHTLFVNNKKVILHILPSGILHKNVIAIIANGVVVSPSALMNEIVMLEKQGFKIRNRIILSESCHLILQYHIEMDLAREKKRGNHAIGTTGCGIGPVYEDKIARRGLRISDLLDFRSFSEKLKENVEYYNHQLKFFYKTKEVNFHVILKEMEVFSKILISIVGDVSSILEKAQKKDKILVFEGAQGALLDIDHGFYPYVTSSNSVSGSVCTGAGIGPKKIDCIVGVVKAYSTRVGNGPFPTEVFGELDDFFCRAGKEFGSTTGRRRRTGWLDIVLLRRVIENSSISKLVLTKLDVLDEIKEIKICIGYKVSNDLKKKRDNIPFHHTGWKAITPIYKVLPGWSSTTLGISKFSKLPILAQSYVKYIETMLDLPIDIISTGPNRKDTIIRNILY